MTPRSLVLAAAAVWLAPAAALAQRLEVSPLAAFVGRWHSIGESHATRYSQAGRSEADLECRWSAGGRFLWCDTRIVAGTDTTEQLSAYGPGSDGRFVLYVMAPGGRPAYTGRVTIAGNTWTYDNPNAPAAGTRWRTINEWVSPAEMHWRAEFTEDGEHWTVTTEGVDTKAG
ncbi:MAG TPA: hypothetical protein VEH62_14880 [Gemmatimonadales bacterium]|nr:hypothetical protein [Gemmatimonadales bacterium]